MTSEDVPVRYIQPSKDEAGNYLSWESVKKLRVSHDENPIVLQQIEIYGVDGINYALAKNGGSAEQSSVHYTGMDYGRAFCVIDGNRAGYKSETAHVPNGWLEVILSEARCIESFAIFNSEFDSCLRANRQLIQLFDDKDQLVYEHRISISEDLPLFDPHHCCSLRFINQESKVVMLNLTLEISDEADTVNIFAHGLSGRPLAAFGCSISEPEAVTNLCQVIYLLSGVPAHEQRLILNEEILRMRFGKGEPPGSLQEICPKLLEAIGAPRTNLE